MEELGMWVATPFYEVDVIDVELPLPLSLGVMKTAL